MNEEYNLTIQEFLYKKSGADHFVHIDENNFEEIKDEMFLSKDEPGNYYLEVNTDRYFKNYAAYCIIDSKGKGAGNIFRADMKPIINFNQGEKLYLYNCRAFTEPTKKLSSNAKEILGIILSFIILLCALFALEPLYGKPRILLAGPIALIGIYQIAKWLIPKFTDRISLKNDDYQKALYVSYTIGQNDKELEINIRNKMDKYYEEQREENSNRKAITKDTVTNKETSKHIKKISRKYFIDDLKIAEEFDKAQQKVNLYDKEITNNDYILFFEYYIQNNFNEDELEFLKNDINKCRNNFNELYNFLEIEYACNKCVWRENAEVFLKYDIIKFKEGD